MAHIARSFGAQVIDNLLVGFKYIGDILDHLERTGQLQRRSRRLNDFVVAAEESHGVLLTPQIRDKDAAGAAVVLAELLCRAEGKRQDALWLSDRHLQALRLPPQLSALDGDAGRCRDGGDPAYPAADARESPEVQSAGSR